MKKITKIVSLSLLAAALFVGCSDPNGGNTDTTGGNTNSENTNNSEPKAPADNSNPADEETPTETVILDMDFSKVTDGIEDAFEPVTYCNLDKSVVKNGVAEISVAEAWDGAFKIATENLDLTDSTIDLTYKVSSNWNYSGADGCQKCVLQIISKDGNDASQWKPYQLSQIEFEKNGEGTSTEWKTLSFSVKDFYANSWDVAGDATDEDKKGAVPSSICAIKINTMDGNGTFYLKSIKIYK